MWLHHLSFSAGRAGKDILTDLPGEKAFYVRFSSPANPEVSSSSHPSGKWNASFSVPSQVGGAGETPTTAFATGAEVYSSVFVSHLVSISLFIPWSFCRHTSEVSI